MKKYILILLFAVIAFAGYGQCDTVPKGTISNKEGYFDSLGGRYRDSGCRDHRLHLKNGDTLFLGSGQPLFFKTDTAAIYALLNSKIDSVSIGNDTLFYYRQNSTPINIKLPTTAVPTLQQVLTAGNTSTRGATVDTLQIGQGTASYLMTYPSLGILRMYNDDNGTAMQMDAGNGFYQFENIVGQTGTLNIGGITGNRLWNFPDKNGTVSMTSDIAGFTEGLVMFGSANGQIRQSTNLYFDSASNKLGIGTLLPTASLHVKNTSALISALRVETNIAASTTGGSTIYAVQDDGTVMQSGELLMNLGAFGNRTGVAGGVGIGARIKASASGTWSPTSTPSNIIFETTPIGTSSTVEAMRISSSQGIHFSNTPQSVNGTDSLFVKDGVTGQLKVVPPSYLKSIAKAYVDSASGWANYTDTNIRRTKPFPIGVDSTKTLPLIWTSAITTQLPLGVDSLYSRADTGILMNDGDAFLARVNFSARATAGGATKYITLELFINGTQGSIYSTTFPLVKGTDWSNYSVNITGFAGTTFATYNGKIKLTALIGDVQIGGVDNLRNGTSDDGISIFVEKTKRAR